MCCALHISNVSLPGELGAMGLGAEDQIVHIQCFHSSVHGEGYLHYTLLSWLWRDCGYLGGVRQVAVGISLEKLHSLKYVIRSSASLQSSHMGA